MIAVLAPAGQAQTPPVPTAVRSAPPPAGEAEATDSPRERGRILQKRNPIASEYQAIGTLGRSPGAGADAEGNDFRRLFPATGAWNGPVTQGGAFYTYQALSGRGAPGFDALVRRRIGAAGSRWGFEARANVTAADRLIEHVEAVWAPLVQFNAAGRRPNSGAVPQLFGGEPVYFLERPRVSQDAITTRTRTALVQAEHELGAQHVVSAQLSLGDYWDDFYRNRIELNMGSGAVVSGSGDRPQGSTTVLEGTYRDAVGRRYFARTKTDRDILRAQVSGRITPPGWRIDYGVYHGKWTNRVDSDGYNFADRSLDLAYRVRVDEPFFPELRVTNRPNLADASVSTFNDLRAAVTSTRDVDDAARFDVERRLAWGGGRLWLTTGGLFRRKERDNGTQRDVYLRDPARAVTLAEYASPSPGQVVRGRYLQPPGLATDRVRGAAGTPGFRFDAARTRLESEQDRYTSAESVWGGFLSGLWVRGPWEIEVGFRVERTKTEALGTVIAPLGGPGDDPTRPFVVMVTENGATSAVRRAPGANDYSTPLPSVAVVRRLGKEWTVRAAAFEQLMRPQYFDIVSYRRVNPPTTTITEGNPRLRPTAIRTGLLAAEYRTPLVGDLAVELYHTEVREFFYSAQDFEPINGDLYTVTRVENGDRGRMRGAQVQWSRRFKVGAGRIDPSVSYTYSASRATVPTRPADRLTLPDRSKHLLRASLGWARGVVGGSFDVSSQSASLDEVGPVASRDGFRDDVFSFDAGAWWQVTPRWRATLAGTNLTNAPERSYEATAFRVTRNQYSSTTWRLGVEAKW